MFSIERYLAAKLGLELEQVLEWAESDTLIQNFIRSAGIRVGNGQGLPPISEVTRNYYLRRWEARK